MVSEAEIQEKLEKLDAAVKDAKENLGDTEIRDACLARAEYFREVGQKERAVEAFEQTLEKTVSLGHRLDIVFTLICMALVDMDHKLIAKNMERANSLMDEGGDWERRNRLKVYTGVYRLAVRDFAGAATLLLATLSTFTCYELLSYEDFVTYTVIASALALDRVALGAKVVKAPEVHEVAQSRPLIAKFVESLHGCRYAEFFEALADIEDFLRNDRYMKSHRGFYVREMRIVGYAQLLESYHSLTLASLAASFAVSEAFIDRELSKFIAAGRLRCRIDAVAGVVESNRNEHKSVQYAATLRHGDALLGRIQKLSRVITV